jgi:hypothetical protein
MTHHLSIIKTLCTVQITQSVNAVEFWAIENF